MRRIRESRGERMDRYEALSRSFRRHGVVFVSARRLMAPIFWSEWTQNIIRTELHALDYYERKAL